MCHQAISQAKPTSWCAQESPINPALILNTLITKINSLREQSSNKKSLRARLTIGPSHTISFTTSPMPSLPTITILISLDNQPTSYHQDPFLLTKTTQRNYYDDTRTRHGATYTPNTGDIFDVLMFNESRQVTETTISNVAIRRKQSLGSTTTTDNPWITPHLSCGLLNGVHRQFLIGKGKIMEGVIKIDDLITEGLETWEVMCFNEVRHTYHAQLINLNQAVQTLEFFKAS
ncbi:uncharacterized protein VP01_3953g4 [Puccinia sorghi]|uniref:Uncharacterized protein n=1 Tax=Puccinia sorghi TaxID=27349 RepID=A0A0L6USC7_9BASI|nr:uncharacterized protein VP01_3953g4 [Puccinia sorghi]